VAAICGAAILWRVHKAKAIERKLAETARAYRVRAEHGDAKAQRSLGSSYARGEALLNQGIAEIDPDRAKTMP